MDIEGMPVQIEDRIADELSGTVVRYIPAAVRVDDLDARGFDHRLVAQQVIVTATAPDRDHRLMLGQDQRVIRAAHHGLMHFLLQLPDFAVIGQSIQADKLQGSVSHNT